MKKLLIVLGLTMVVAIPAHADEATSTPFVGGHRRPYVAGLIDSVNNKGAWLLSNSYLGTQIVYIKDNPVTSEEIAARKTWKQVLLSVFHIDVL